MEELTFDDASETAAELGWKEGDKFVVLQEYKHFKKGDIVYLVFDDGTLCPLFSKDINDGEGSMNALYVYTYEVEPYIEKEKSAESKFKIGDKVKVVNSGQVYDHYFQGAEKYALDNWEFGSIPENGDTGIIDFIEYDNNSIHTKYYINIEGMYFIMNSKGLELSEEPTIEKPKQLEISDIAVGDKVKVVCMVDNYDTDGMGVGKKWNNGWTGDMVEYVGKTFTIRFINESLGVRLSEDDFGFDFPLKALELVEKAPVVEAQPNNTISVDEFISELKTDVDNKMSKRNLFEEYTKFYDKYSKMFNLSMTITDSITLSFDHYEFYGDATRIIEVMELLEKLHG